VLSTSPAASLCDPDCHQRGAGCFLLVHITPGDPLVAILRLTRRRTATQLRIAYVSIAAAGPVRALAMEGGQWRSRHSIATGRPVLTEVMRRSATPSHGGPRRDDRIHARLFFGLIAGYSAIPGSTGRYLDRGRRVSVPHYWLGCAVDHLLRCSLTGCPAVGAAPAFRCMGMTGTHPPI